MPVLHWWGQDTQRPAVFCGTDEHGGVGPCSYQVLVVPGFSPEEMKQRVQTPTRVKNDSTHIFFPQNCSSISLCCHSTWPACWPPEQVSLLLWVPPCHSAVSASCHCLTGVLHTHQASSALQKMVSTFSVWVPSSLWVILRYLSVFLFVKK